MRPVVAYQLVSLDGVAESPERWVFNHFDTDMDDHLRELLDSQDTVLLGRVTYELWASYWPTSTHEPFASFINRTPKYVFANSLPDTTWSNFTMVTDDLGEYVDKLRAQPGKDIGVHGSIELTRSLLRADLVDELRLAVMPVLAGSGKRLLDESLGARRLRLIQSRQTSSGGLLLRYGRRTRD